MSVWPGCWHPTHVEEVACSNDMAWTRRLISSSPREELVPCRNSIVGGAASIRRMMGVALVEYRSRVCGAASDVESRPSSVEYCMKVVASCDIDKWKGRAPSCLPVRRSRSTRRRNSDRHSVVRFRTLKSRASYSV